MGRRVKGPRLEVRRSATWTISNLDKKEHLFSTLHVPTAEVGRSRRGAWDATQMAQLIGVAEYEVDRTKSRAIDKFKETPI